ncbi:hypothetical protein Nepgr_020855 [Nepenthes gracilis]|uniref:WIT1/2 N-terminal helical bundle domain-containing protein n=1 Tax=Nepenthes gracilis TaxID=150966 RepID=A0AAD3SXP1_NEPGR|nr:hypothetical protein Nepgr_020855 [Nepenthes gracilis]
MDTDILPDSTVSVFDGEAGGWIKELSHNDPMEGISSTGEMVRELGSVHEFLVRLELDLARASEKLLNLNILMTHVAAMESDFESFLEKDETHVDSTEKALQFDLLSGIFDSEVRELDDFIATLQREILNAREIIMPSYKHLDEALFGMEEKLHDSEESLNQLQDQVSEMRTQSAKCRRILSSLSAKENDDDKLHTSETSGFLDMNAKIQMQTSEQQRHILRMLEKSLARELDLEKSFTETKLTEEELKLRLHDSVQQVLSMEEQTTVLLQKFFEADNVAEVLMGTSKELMGLLQLSKLSLNCAIQREGVLKSNLQDSSKVFNVKKGEIMNLREKSDKEERRAKSAEARCKLLEDAVKKLNEELSLVRKNENSVTEKVDSLEKKLQEADIQLEEQVAVIDASEEKQNMMYSEISDMEHLIEDMRSKVSEAESRADSAEEKWIILSESNAELGEELNDLRGRLECLEASMHQEEKTKGEIARDINLRTKVMTDLVMKLAIEREHVQNQISSLMKENIFSAEKFQAVSIHPSVKIGKEALFSKRGGADVSSEKEAKEGKEFFASNKLGFEGQDVSEAEAESDPADLKSKLDSARTIDAGRLSFKFIVVAILVSLIAIIATCFLK